MLILDLLDNFSQVILLNFSFTSFIFINRRLIVFVQRLEGAENLIKLLVLSLFVPEINSIRWPLHLFLSVRYLGQCCAVALHEGSQRINVSHDFVLIMSVVHGLLPREFVQIVGVGGAFDAHISIQLPFKICVAHYGLF